MDPVIGLRFVMIREFGLEFAGKRGAKLVGEVVAYKAAYRLCYIWGPDGLRIGLAQKVG